MSMFFRGKVLFDLSDNELIDALEETRRQLAEVADRLQLRALRIDEWVLVEEANTRGLTT